VILTNPPFGGIEGRHIQANFPVPSSATELLFLQHIMKKLKPRDGARCGMVVPESTLFRGGAFAEVKRDLLAQFNLHTVVSLPPGAFAPSSDVKTALIFFERPGPTREIWYYELPLPEGLKKFSKGSPIQDEHFAEDCEFYLYGQHFIQRRRYRSRKSASRSTSRSGSRRLRRRPRPWAVSTSARRSPSSTYTSTRRVSGSAIQYSRTPAWA